MSYKSKSKSKEKSGSKSKKNDDDRFEGTQSGSHKDYDASSDIDEEDIEKNTEVIEKNQHNYDKFLAQYDDKKIRRAYRRWIDYITRHRPHDDAKTHVSQVTPKGTFYISSNIISEFYNEYNLARNAGVPLGMAEYTQNTLPVIADFDLRFNAEYGYKRLYKSRHIEGVVRCFQDAIKQLYIDINDKNLYCVVLEKGDKMRDSVKGLEVKDGWHIHFPFCKINNLEQRTILREHVLELLRDRHIIDKLERISNSTLETIYDRNCITAPWLMYGSTKMEGGQHWQITRLYLDNATPTTFEKVFGCDDDEDVYPIVLSVNNRELPLMQLKTEYRKVDDLDIIKPKKFLTAHEHKNIREYVHEANKYLKIIDDEFWEDHNKRMEIGWAIHNISKGSDTGYKLWNKYCQKNSKYDEKKCEDEWKRMREGTSGMGTICWYAQKSNSKEFKKVKEKLSGITVVKLMNDNTYDQAEYIHSIYEGRFVCTDIKKDIWYEFDRHRWHELDSGNTLFRLIPRDIVKHINKYVKEISKNKLFSEDEIAAKKEVCKRTIKKLKDHTYRKKLISELKTTFFYDPEFSKKLNVMNKKLIVFENGVYDLAIDCFRDGRPTDYMEFTTRYNYETTMTKDDERVIATEKFLEQIQPNPNIRKYFIRWLSSCLQTGNIDKVFLLWTGPLGNNGKSKTSEFLEETFGDFFLKFPMGTLTDRRNAGGGTSSDIARVTGKKLGGLQESNHNDVINIGKFKEITGDESMYAREIFSKGKEVRPDMKLYLECNRPPKVPVYDKAFYNRLRVIPFEVEFCYNAPLEVEEQFRKKKFPLDKNISEKLKIWKPALVWILINEYRNYVKYGLHEPEEVMIATNEYRRNNDSIMQFIDEVIEHDAETKIVSDSAPFNEIYALYKEWMRDNYPSQKIQEHNDILDDLSLRWGKPVFHGKSYRWKGYKIKLDVDIIETKKSTNLSPSSLIQSKEKKSKEKHKKHHKEHHKD